MLFEHTKCKKCHHINPAYKYICNECKSYLRERVVNIDLWNTIQLILEDPLKAFKQIIFAEHKNFIIFITFLIAVKNLIVTRFFSVPALGINGVDSPFYISLALSIPITFLLFSSLTLIQKRIYFNNKIILRFKDIYTINIYAFIPYLLGLIFIFPIELVVLGGDVFSNNPYSFEIKPLVTYILAGFELITILWSFFLLIKSITLIFSNRFYSILITSIYSLIWFVTLHLSSKIIFTI